MEKIKERKIKMAQILREKIMKTINNKTKIPSKIKAKNNHQEKTSIQCKSTIKRITKMKILQNRIISQGKKIKRWSE